jgi:adenine-specific DNA methylase
MNTPIHASTACRGPRLIEHAFPLKQTSLDSVHEKNVRHGHISTLHIWPARRPLAACRAALIATLLPDPGTPEGRKELCEKIGGKLVKKIERKKMPDGSIVEREKEETEGGILHWGRETENKADLDWFRAEIKKAYGGRAPKVLDPFAGGGAIPLEAMRLGCEATAVDINPVAWFILKCTLEYPQKLAGKTHPLPDFILENEEFMNAFYKAHPYLVGRTKKTKKQAEEDAGTFPEWVKEDSGRAPKADLAWHVRAWGQWVLERARRELAQFYPTYADFETLKLTAKDVGSAKPYEKRPMQIVPLKDDGTPDIGALNKEFSPEYLADKKNPRWVAKPTVTYLWARTVKCKNCRAILPLLKTRWLCKTDKKRVLLSMQPKRDMTGVAFDIETNVPAKGGNAAQRREHDKRIAAGTMSRSGVKCPCCGTIMTMEDIRVEGKGGRLGAAMTAVVMDGQNGKSYRLPTEHEIQMAVESEKSLADVFAQIPFGMPEEPTPKGGSGASRAFSVDGYGFDHWKKLFTSRQLLSLGTFVKWTRGATQELERLHYDHEWIEAVTAYLALQNDKVADYNSQVCMWHISRELIGHTFTRFALPITWDFVELDTINDVGGSYSSQLDWLSRYIDHGLVAGANAERPQLRNQSAIGVANGDFDAVVTDPPYYDAIPYSDLMDFFYLWLKRSLNGLSPELDDAFHDPLSPKWDHDKNDGELIDDASRHDGDRARSKAIYEEGMARVFQGCGSALKPEGKMIVVFANKQPDAWETLVSALIRSGFVVDGSWPIQTEMSTRMRAKTSAALASSVWLVCKKRPATAKPGWDNQVLEDMRTNIRVMLREFWDAGIRGPDFVWAATGPAMEAYSKHPVVKKANEPGPMTVSEFLTHVRRIVVDFVVGRVLSGDKEGDADSAAADRLDEVTAYYLLHRHDFGMDEAPAGACILYAISCGISDKELSATWDLIGFTKGKGKDDEQEEADADAESDAETEEESGSKVKLKTWAQREGKSMGYEAPGGKPIPLIDRVHCLMHLWKAGDLSKVDGYLDGNGLRRHELFKRLLQSLIELSPHGSEERSLMESISNHVGARGAVRDDQMMIRFAENTEDQS